ncbi:hypothetical protein N0V95_004100 [Ascochyta clinopodiicola]|nr:hypothetical protein N0V95_004100 [Ascochyta clinopodiicola]
MAGKRRSFDKIEDVACNQNRTSLLLKRQKQDNSATDTAYNVAEISEFEDGISKIKDWKSSTVDRRHVQVIYWSDIEGLTRSSLPSHVTTGFGTFKQEWTMPELEDLYVLAISVGAFDVCDMVIDFWHKEMRRPNQRVVQDEFGDTTVFSILDFGPEFLNFLQENDVKGFYFFLNVLIMHGQAGYDLLRSMQLGNWHTKVKKTLTSAIKSGRTIDLVTISPKFVCFSEHVPDRLRQIKNSHVDNRMHYANPKHNAHHDTRAICEEKIRIVKEKINLFKEAGIELDDEEFERLTSGSTMSGVEAEEEAYEGEHQDEEWD